MGHHKECPYCGLPLDEQPRTNTPNRFKQHDSVTTFGWDSRLTFGKHKGRLVSEVHRDDPAYLDWALENVEWLTFSDDVIEMMESIPF